MQENRHPRANAEPSEDELRRMLDARELEKEHERKRQSRLLTWMMLAGGALLAGVVFAFPWSPRRAAKDAGEPQELAAKAARLREQFSQPAIEDPVIRDEMKPFTAKPGEDSIQGDIRFTMELLNFCQKPGVSQNPGAEAAAPPSAKPVTPRQSP